MTKVISFLNMKGGVGKSTLCFNMAYTAANHFNKKILVIDMDPQFNTTQALMEKYYSSEYYLDLVKEKKTVLRIFQNTTSIIQRAEEKIVPPKEIIQSLGDNLSIICGDLDLIMIESSTRGTENLLEGFIQRVIEEEDFDFIFIDCPPTHSFYTTSSLIASNYYLAPVKPDMYSLLGVELLQSVVSNVNTMNRARVQCLGLIFTMVRPTSVTQRRIIDSVREKNKGIKVFDKEMLYFQYNETGRIETFMYDMVSTKDRIVEITDEFIKELE
ncbi:ParA family protein [Peribacillus butanolivorans]|uniref:ParA family protein n=1 Tax=Peribacillus butanolivorans TaxID=421767 RepID=A0ABN5N2L0_9BACI|nr:ParA family protein [Peribacillus butanolivorans]AXN39626.1 ParA family protein [Peribacillus butanolivorans]